jgi:transposase
MLFILAFWGVYTDFSAVFYLVENCFLSLKRWRGIATRYAKTSDAFIAAVHVRCIAIWAAIRA